MTRRVIITSLAEKDALTHHTWWGHNRSMEQANRWLEDIYATMRALATMADKHPAVTEIML